MYKGLDKSLERINARRSGSIMILPYYPQGQHNLSGTKQMPHLLTLSPTVWLLRGRPLVNRRLSARQAIKGKRKSSSHEPPLRGAFVYSFPPGAGWGSRAAPVGGDASRIQPRIAL